MCCTGAQLGGLCGSLGVFLVVIAVIINDLADLNVKFADGTSTDMICEWEQICLGGSCETYDNCPKLPNMHLTKKDCSVTKKVGIVYLAMCSTTFVIGCIAVICQCVNKLLFVGKYSHLLYIVCSICCVAGPVIFLYYGDQGAKCWDKNYGYDHSIGGSFITLFVTSFVFILSATLPYYLSKYFSKNRRKVEDELLIQNSRENVVEDNISVVDPHLMWLIFGGGFIMLFFWYLCALIATILLIPAPNSVQLFKISPSIITPSTKYTDATTTNLSLMSKISLCFWIFPFGLILVIIHFTFCILYLPLLYCGCLWSEYHWRSISNVFNPQSKLIIDCNINKFNFYTNSWEIVAGVHNLGSKVCIITGCNTGIGKETAKQLYSIGMIVVMACRNPVKATQARNDIIEQVNGRNPNHLIFIQLDLADLQTIDEFVSNYHNNEIINGKVDFLINNAGVMAFPKYGTTKDGLERQFGINHVGHFYLVNKLLSVLKANKTRIINVSSCAHYLFNDAQDMTAFLDDASLQGPTPDIIPYNKGGFRYYGISKLCNVLFTRQLNKLYNEYGIVALCLHPGNIMGTDLMRNMRPSIGVCCSGISLNAFHELAKQKTITRGAATTLRCVTITNEEIFGGVTNPMLYFDDCMPRNEKLHQEFVNGQNTQIDQSLWDYTCRLLESFDYLQLNQ